MFVWIKFCFLKQLFFFQNGSALFQKLDYTKMAFPKLDSGSDLMSFLGSGCELVFCKPFSF